MTELKCALIPMEHYESIFGKRGEKTKLGSYHGSYFWDLKGFGSDKWVVSLAIDVNLNQYLADGLTEKEIVVGCLEFLNKPVGKRKKKQPYGNLEILTAKGPSSEPNNVRYRYCIKEREDQQYLSLLATTDQKKNKYFWGKGQAIPRSLRKHRA